MVKHHYAVSNTTGYLKFTDHAAQFVGKIERREHSEGGDVEIQTTYFSIFGNLDQDSYILMLKDMN